MQNPSASMLVIGDEILSGRTRDSNMHYLAIELTKVGIDLKEVRVISDLEVEIVQAVTQLSEKYDYVFTSGGIGPTHDDITADAIGLAFNLEVKVCAEAKQILEAHYLNSEVELVLVRNTPTHFGSGFKAEKKFRIWYRFQSEYGKTGNR